MMSQCSRRQFLRNISMASLAAGAAVATSGCPSLTTPPYAPSTGTAEVVAVRGRDLYQMARDALDAWGGAKAIINRGESVFLKPNLLTVDWITANPVTSGECTKVEIVVAVAEACLEAGAREVIIGDGAQIDQFSYSQWPTLDGQSDMAAEATRLNNRYGNRVRLACLSVDSPAWDTILSPWSGLGKIHVSSLAARADRIISLPVAKTHLITQVTFALKNMMGVTSPIHYGMGTPSRLGLHFAKGGIEQAFLDIVRALQPDFTIIDFSICCEGNGPAVVPDIMSETVDMRDRLGDWLLLAGRDLAAASAVGSRIMGIEPENVKHLRMAHEQGFGQIRADSIDLRGERLEDLQVAWTPASMATLFTKGLGPEYPEDPPERWMLEYLAGA
ncbi:MAG TPA: DUF362 domain-containing protein [Candidatus Hydrogenedentes bacterium]|nr:DUF362 domain-containing protein [Candidatus Hydrogenedentota bacterium]HPG67674.1 DUF362 domain-containing protein [Candidatus Hydrogenedentota bacterium]